jgi:alpha-glucosidase (family GH31 glycosyl hydrolase)
MEITRRALLQGAALTAGVFVRPKGAPFAVAAQAVSAVTIRILFLPAATTGRAGTPAAQILDDGALVRQQWPERPVTRGAPGPARSEGLQLNVSDDLVVSVAAGERIVQQLRADLATNTLGFLLGRGPLLGLGEGGPQFDRRGTTDEMRNGQDGYRLRTHGARVPVQWIVGTEGWGLYVHQPLGTIDLTGSEGRFAATALLPLDVFVVVSNDPAVLLREYAVITGHAELPARWTFGYMQSHRTLAGPDEVLGVARTFRDKRLPCDALIYLGTEFTPSGWNTRNGEFTWNARNFPDPRGTIDALHAMHYKVVLHTVIEGRQLTGTVDDPCATPEPSGRDAGDRWPDRRTVGCYWPHHKGVFDLGVDGWWPDQGDGLDAASRLARIRMYWEGSRRWRPGERPFALHRNGYAGMQRYGAFLWSGDVYTTWETLRTQVAVGINAGLSGMPFWGTDIGGFVPTAEYTGELHVRWFQFGAFCPLFRAHGRDWHLRLPWGWNTGELGPMEVTGYTGGAANPDPRELRNASVEPICRKYLELRYRLLPYIYTAARACCDTGLPMIRAMWLQCPDDPQAVAIGDQYFWGRDVLVAPVIERGATSRRLYLPRGTWHDFWTESPVDGGRWIDRDVDLETIPLYVRAGAVIPFDPVRQFTDEPVNSPLTLTVYPRTDGMSDVYEDDGASFEHKRGNFMRLVARWDNLRRTLTLSLGSGSRLFGGSARLIEIRRAGEARTQSVRFDGSPTVVRL